MANPVPNPLALSIINTGDVAQSAPLRNNNAAIQTAVNELIACLSGGTAGQRLQAVDGTDVQWVNQITYRKTSAKQVVSTVTETDLLNGEITVGAGVMGATGVLRLTAWGDMVNNSAATQASVRLKLKLGATTLFDTNSVAAIWTSTAARFGWKVVAEIVNLGAANSQWGTLNFETILGAGANGAAGFVTGEGDFLVSLVTGGAGIYKAFGGAASAVDTTIAQALALSVILPAANANLDMTLKGALVEVI